MADFKQNYFQKRTKDRGPRSNNRISSPEVQVIASDGENLGTLNTNEAISDITFDATGTLWAISGGAGGFANPHALLTLDLVTGAATSVAPLTAGAGKTIAFNLLDGLLYYHYYDMF